MEKTIDWEQRLYEIAKEVLPTTLFMFKEKYMNEDVYDLATDVALESAKLLLEKIKEKNEEFARRERIDSRIKGLREKMGDIVDTIVAEMSLSKDTADCLTEAGFATLGEVLTHKPKEIMRIKGIGRKSMSEIKYILKGKYDIDWDKVETA